jgi:cysteine-rich repeat protein
MSRRRVVLVLVAVAACVDPAEPVDGAPVVADQRLTTFEDGAVWFKVEAADPEGAPVSVALGAPAHGILRVSGIGWTYEPDREYSGDDRVWVRASDGLEEATAEVVFHVITVNDRPEAWFDRFATPEDTALFVSPEALLANDLDLEEQPLEVVAVGDAVGGTVALAGGEVVFTPARHFAGTARFRYTMSDGETHDSAGVEVVVGPVNDPPVAYALVTETDEDTGVGIKPQGSDVDSGTLTWAVVHHPAHGTLSLGDEIYYLPDPDFHGEDRFTYTVSDGQTSSPLAGVYIHVAHVLECGDREIEGAETCDDGNASDGDGCSAACLGEVVAP